MLPPPPDESSWSDPGHGVDLSTSLDASPSESLLSPDPDQARDSLPEPEGGGDVPLAHAPGSSKISHLSARGSPSGPSGQPQQQLQGREARSALPGGPSNEPRAGQPSDHDFHRVQQQDWHEDSGRDGRIEGGGGGGREGEVEPQRPILEGVHRFELLAKLGKGAYGCVFLAWDHVEGIEVAVKVVDLEDTGCALDDVHQEINVMSQVQL